MTRLLSNVLYLATFLAGALLLWSGLQGLVLGHGAPVRGAALVGAGVTLWTVLAAAGRRSPPEAPR